eukprot:CAMPEP_0170812264 /NCGR_PEP_ID=MMETSP0733-20121128/35870_1 /TAXON_ID=186038 /ORGANISM="Fragilariopsis kerguelensis, Strain L26-C5" /LENGTH=50 /DNA_ID=CAMNT_0011168819 /DNA_START=38 /DNA_END=190 /DNA_ORIENTATION=-
MATDGTNAPVQFCDKTRLLLAVLFVVQIMGFEIESTLCHVGTIWTRVDRN